MLLEKLKQVTIEGKYSKHNIRQWVLDDLIESELDEEIYNATNRVNTYMNTMYEYELKDGTTKLFGSKNKRMSELRQGNLTAEDYVIECMIVVLQLKEPQMLQTVVGMIAGCIPHEDPFQRAITAGEILSLVSEADLFNISLNGSGEYTMVEPIYQLGEDVLQRFADVKYLPPMICRPNRVFTNYSAQVLTKEHDAVVLGSGNCHKMPLALDAINIANSVKMSLDLRVLNTFKEEMPKLNKEGKPWLPEQVGNFVRMRNASQKVYDELLEEGNEFYFPYKFDKRGRMYSQGYHVNMQGGEFKKALINLNHEEIIDGVPAEFKL